jgi:hypothetical protein
MYKVHPVFLLLLGIAIGTLLGILIAIYDASKGGGTYVPKYEHCPISAGK